MEDFEKYRNEYIKRKEASTEEYLEEEFLDAFTSFVNQSPSISISPVNYEFMREGFKEEKLKMKNKITNEKILSFLEEIDIKLNYIIEKQVFNNGKENS